MFTRRTIVSAWLIFACMLLLSGAASGETFPVPEQLIVLEDLIQEPAVLAAMHDQLVALEFGLARPLLGRLEGQGNLWNIPEEMTMDEAIAVASGLTAVTGTYDAWASTGREWLTPCVIVIPGEVTLGFFQEHEESARQALMYLGFLLLSTSVISSRESWGFPPMEYTVAEAMATVEQIEGIFGVSPILVNLTNYPPGDVNRDRIVNIMDLLSVRNHLNDDPASLGSDDDPEPDVNGDGFINVLDIIYVRNRLGTSCR